MTVPAAFFAMVRPHMLVATVRVTPRCSFKPLSSFNVATGSSRFSKDILRAHPELILKSYERRRCQADIDRAGLALILESEQKHRLSANEPAFDLETRRPDFNPLHSLSPVDSASPSTVAEREGAGNALPGRRAQ